MKVVVSNYGQIGFAVARPAGDVVLLRLANGSIKPLASCLGGKIKKSLGGRSFYLHVTQPIITGMVDVKN
ncbi:MAG: hypothetical protein KAS94_15595 [Desulfobulbaceae bacterium]|nr:hypothetical protein [Desulfobulbaceae bacterium]